METVGDCSEQCQRFRRRVLKIIFATCKYFENNDTHPEKKVEHPSFRKNALCKFALSRGATPLFRYKDREKI